jgi:hypothetical protein
VERSEGGDFVRHSEGAAHGPGVEARIVEAGAAEEEAVALLRRAADVQGAADVECMTLLAAHLVRARRGGSVEGQRRHRFSKYSLSSHYFVMSMCIVKLLGH